MKTTFALIGLLFASVTLTIAQSWTDLPVNQRATNNCWIWASDPNVVYPSTNKEFTVYAAHGIRLLGSPISGDGSGIAIFRTTPAPSAPSNAGYFWNSNSALYWVTATKTNLINNGL
jgi:hypothetical protein